jgi:hypothetical protein
MAANSTQLIADETSVIANGPSATTKANAIAQAGPIMDYIANTKLVLEKYQETTVLLAKIITETDPSTDATNLTLLDAVQATLLGTVSPTATCVTNLKTAYNNGPSSVTKANAIAQAGAIMDYPGNMKLCEKKLQEANVLIGYLVDVTDAGTDGTNRNLLLGQQQVLV